MGVLLGDGTANFVVTVSSVFLLNRFSLAAKLLEGLNIFDAQSLEDKSPEKSGRKGNSRTAKWLNKAAVRQKIYAEGAENLSTYKLPLGASSKCPLYEEFELLVNLGVVLFLNALVCATPLTDLHLASTTWLICIALSAPIAVLFLVLKAEIFSKSASEDDKRYLWIASIFSILLAVGATFLPPSILDFDWESSAEDASEALVKARQRFHVSPETVDSIQIPDTAIKILVAILGGLLGGCFLPGSLRTARSFMLGTEPPPFASKFVKANWFESSTMILALSLPFLGVFAWIRPLFQDLLNISEDSVDLGRAGLILTLSFLALCAVKPLLSGYLSSSLVVWWTYKHAIVSWEQSKNIGDLIQKRMRGINVLMCKVGIEFLAPAILWGALACLFTFATVQSNPIPGYVWLQENLQSRGFISRGTKQDTSVPFIFLYNLSGFLIWWTSLSWALGFSAFITLFRTGMLPEV